MGAISSRPHTVVRALVQLQRLQRGTGTSAETDASPKYCIYDAENNLLSITDANGHATSFQYDAFGRVTQTTFPSNLFETYQYDGDNNLTSKTDRKGQTIQYVYDALNRLTQKSYPDSASVEYTYDLVGKAMQLSDPTGTYALAYDNMGRLIGTTTTYHSCQTHRSRTLTATTRIQIGRATRHRMEAQTRIPTIR